MTVFNFLVFVLVKMKSYIYKEVKLSLQYGEHFTEDGLSRAKKMTHHMLEKGIDPASMHLIFSSDGFICSGSKANGKVLELKKNSTGDEAKFWVAKSKKASKEIVTIVLVSLFLLAILAQYS